MRSGERPRHAAAGHCRPERPPAAPPSLLSALQEGLQRNVYESQLMISSNVDSTNQPAAVSPNARQLRLFQRPCIMPAWHLGCTWRLSAVAMSTGSSSPVSISSSKLAKAATVMHAAADSLDWFDQGAPVSSPLPRSAVSVS